MALSLLCLYQTQCSELVPVYCFSPIMAWGWVCVCLQEELASVGSVNLAVFVCDRAEPDLSEIRGFNSTVDVSSQENLAVSKLWCPWVFTVKHLVTLLSWTLCACCRYRWLPGSVGFAHLDLQGSAKSSVIERPVLSYLLLKNNSLFPARRCTAGPKTSLHPRSSIGWILKQAKLSRYRMWHDVWVYKQWYSHIFPLF